jgi:hypothetical protein
MGVNFDTFFSLSSCRREEYVETLNRRTSWAGHRNLARTKIDDMSPPSISSPLQHRTTNEQLSPKVTHSFALTNMTHIMASYAWGQHQDLVRQAVLALKSKGVDVWIDTEGSSLLEKMQGSTDEMMIKAVNLSSHVIIFFSKKYILSPNCNQEVWSTMTT